MNPSLHSHFPEGNFLAFSFNSSIAAERDARNRLAFFDEDCEGVITGNIRDRKRNMEPSQPLQHPEAKLLSKLLSPPLHGNGAFAPPQ